MKKNYNPFWTPQLEQLQEIANKARVNMETTPLTTTQQNTAKPELSSSEKYSCRQGKSEKDASKLWNLTNVLNEEAPSDSMTILHVNNKLLTDKKTANEFAKLNRRENTLPLTPKKVGDMKEKLK